MPRGDKSKYTDKEKRQAEHIEEGYESRGIPENEAERRPGRRSTRFTEAGKNPEGVATAGTKTTNRCAKVVAKEDTTPTAADRASPRKAKGHPMDALFRAAR